MGVLRAIQTGRAAMTEREVPSPCVAWHADSGRTYRRKIDCYYAIAKKLVVAKYPTYLNSDSVEEFEAKWRFDFKTIEEAHARAARAEALFFGESLALLPPYESSPYFNEKKWKRFIMRVAKFLAFVDSKSGLRAELLHASEKRLHDEFSYAERQAQVWMERARAIETLRKTRRPA